MSTNRRVRALEERTPPACPALSTVVRDLTSSTSRDRAGGDGNRERRWYSVARARRSASGGSIGVETSCGERMPAAVILRSGSG